MIASPSTGEPTCTRAAGRKQLRIEYFYRHPRMAMIYRSWEKMDADKRRRIFARGQWLFDHPETL